MKAPVLLALTLVAVIAITRSAHANECDQANSACLEWDNTADAGVGLSGSCLGKGGTGVDGLATGSGSAGVSGGTDVGYGVLGQSSGGIGVYGLDTSAAGTGVYGAAFDVGVHGEGTGTGTTYGVLGAATNTSGSGQYGVYGEALGNGGSGNYGVYGTSLGTSSYGVYGIAYNSSSYGVYGYNASGVAAYGYSNAAAEPALYGYNHAVNGAGVEGDTADGYAVIGNSTQSHAIYGDSGGSTHAGVYGTNSNGGYGVFGTCSGTNCIAVYVNGNGEYTGSWSHVSDERLKKDIEPLRGPLDQLLRLRGVSFYWKDPAQHGNNDGIQRGFIAQDFEKVFPEWVKTDKDGFKTIDTTGLSALEVESIRTLKADNDELRKRIEALENGRFPVVSVLGRNGAGFGIAGIAMAGAIVFLRRHRKDEERA